MEAKAAAELKPVYEAMIDEVERVFDSQMKFCDEAAEVAVARFFLAAASMLPVDPASARVWSAIDSFCSKYASGDSCGAKICSDWSVVCDLRSGALKNLGAVGAEIYAALRPLARNVSAIEPVDRLIEQGVSDRQICRMYGLLRDDGGEDMMAVERHRLKQEVIPTPPPVEHVQQRSTAVPGPCRSLMVIAKLIRRDLEALPA